MPTLEFYKSIFLVGRQKFNIRPDSYLCRIPEGLSVLLSAYTQSALFG